MDWQVIRQVASDMGVNTSFCGDAWLGFIPERPNDPADAEWLKERGWVKSAASVRHKTLDIFVRFDTQVPAMFVKYGDPIYNPTRMTVALFEAAAREAMKHGE